EGAAPGPRGSSGSTGTGPRGDAAGRGRGPQGRPSAPGDQPYDDPSTARTRRSERAPGAGATGQGPAGRPARADQGRPGAGGSAHPGHGPRPTGTRHPDAAQDHRPTSRGTTGDPAGPGGTPYDDAAAGRSGYREGDADSGRQPGPGARYARGRGQEGPQAP
ncbi:hypothetical protein JBE27_54345, partial [Streptomyces albiflaviniger]|nr:hypothetical protein [Streptomyces albiflaviniger]